MSERLSTSECFPLTLWTSPDPRISEYLGQSHRRERYNYFSVYLSIPSESSSERRWNKKNGIFFEIIPIEIRKTGEWLPRISPLPSVSRIATPRLPIVSRKIPRSSWNRSSEHLGQRDRQRALKAGKFQNSKYGYSQICITPDILTPRGF